MRTRLRRLGLLAIGAAFALGSLAPTRPAAAARPRKVTNEPYDAEFRAEVRTAIRKGIGYLRDRQMENGASGAAHRFKEAAAVLWVLRRAGIAIEGPQDEYTFRILRARAPDDVEQASLLVLALCAVPLTEGDPFAVEGTDEAPALAPLPDADRAVAEKAVALLLEAQVTTGQLPTPPRGLDLPPDLLAMETRGGWSQEFRPTGRMKHADVRHTYLALLALEAAARRGLEVPPERFLLALELLLRWQAPKGRRTTLALNEVRGDTRLEWKVRAHARGFGWAASMSDETSGFETAAGAAGLAICKDALRGRREFDRKLARRTDEALHDALAWIQKHYTIEENPEPHERGDIDTTALYHHHWLQALARLAIHLRLRFVGKHDWYREGAELLVREQQEDGSWEAIWWSNCYALLFLQRASLRSIEPVITPSED